MTKQEEIREGIAKILQIGYDPGIPLMDKPQQILSYLHSQGVVIKVDRELPKYMPSWNVDEFYDGTEDPHWRDELRPTTIDDYLKAGFVAAESLVVP